MGEPSIFDRIERFAMMARSRRRGDLSGLFIGIFSSARLQLEWGVISETFCCSREPPKEDK